MDKKPGNYSDPAKTAQASVVSVIASVDPGARQNICNELDNICHCEGALATAAIC